MGINRKTARTVVFGTCKYGGLGLDHFSAVQGFAQLQYLIVNLRTQDTTHKADGVQRRRHIELTNVYGVTDSADAGEHNTADSIYTSSMGECCHALPKHVRRLVGNITDLDLPADFDCTEPTDLIIATDDSVLFGVVYHS
jgi:hypothetical protein